MPKFDRYFCQFTITGAQNKWSVKDNAPSGQNPFEFGNLSMVTFQCDSSVHFNIHENTGSPYPLAANATFAEVVDGGSEIADVFLTTTGTTVVYFYGRR